MRELILVLISLILFLAYIRNIIKLVNIEKELLKWTSRQEHDKCWYYPDIFRKICNILGIEETDTSGWIVPEKEFEEGCNMYRKELYNKELYKNVK